MCAYIIQKDATDDRSYTVNGDKPFTGFLRFRSKGSVANAVADLEEKFDSFRDLDSPIYQNVVNA